MTYTIPTSVTSTRSVLLKTLVPDVRSASIGSASTVSTATSYLSVNDSNHETLPDPPMTYTIPTSVTSTGSVLPKTLVPDIRSASIGSASTVSTNSTVCWHTISYFFQISFLKNFSWIIFFFLNKNNTVKYNETINFFFNISFYVNAG